MEEWKPISLFPGYEVSDLGRVRSIDRIAWNGRVFHELKGRILKQQTLRNGYKSAMFSVDGKTTRVMIHRCVALEFVNEIDGKECVNHKDGDRSNNASSNLEWVTPIENSHHGGAYKGHILATSIDREDIILIKGWKDLCSRGFIYSSVIRCVEGISASHKGFKFRRIPKNDSCYMQG